MSCEAAPLCCIHTTPDALAHAHSHQQGPAVPTTAKAVLSAGNGTFAFNATQNATVLLNLEAYFVICNADATTGALTVRGVGANSASSVCSP